MNDFESIIRILFQTLDNERDFHLFDASGQFKGEAESPQDITQKLNAGFLIMLAGPDHSGFEKARKFLNEMADTSEWKDITRFYVDGIDAVRKEIADRCKAVSGFGERLNLLSKWLSDKENLQKDRSEIAEKVHTVFFPEAVGINNARTEKIESLRKKRTVTITELNTEPISDPAKEILFTSNVLLTIPSGSISINDMPYSDELKQAIADAAAEPQLYWYDHPVQIGVAPEKNEILYGLKGLDEAIGFECEQGNISKDARATCLLSVSVTHQGLQTIAGQYLKEELLGIGGLKHVDVYAFTEADTRNIVNDVLMPAMSQYKGREREKKLFEVFGVDGEYGRHYSFLKAIAAFWQVFINQDVRATFKIDLDQVFPQKEMVDESGLSAFDHFMTPLWGAHGTDSNGKPVDLGMIAGALVNEKDIARSLFTPDVIFPDRDLNMDEYVFFNAMPQALSTEAEMMTRYKTNEMDGENQCIQRIHVTGGTNGILIDALRRYRPFTPSFIGRAEDQAYILSVILNPGESLRYVHKDGLIMRHDKDAFAKEAIQAAHIGTLIGDYIRILYYSAYSRVLTDDVEELKKEVDPFTGCFISVIPMTIVYLRFALKAASFFIAGKGENGHAFIAEGIKRILKVLEFIEGDPSMLKQKYESERLEWGLYYDLLFHVENTLKDEDSFALELQERARGLIKYCSYKKN